MVDVAHERGFKSPIPHQFFRKMNGFRLVSRAVGLLLLFRDLVAIDTCRPFPTSSCSEFSKPGSRVEVSSPGN